MDVGAVSAAVAICSSRRRHTSWPRDWSSDVCSSDLCEYLASDPVICGKNSCRRTPLGRAVQLENQSCCSTGRWPPAKRSATDRKSVVEGKGVGRGGGGISNKESIPEIRDNVQDNTQA